MGNLTTLAFCCFGPAIVLGIVLFFLYRVAANRRSADRLFTRAGCRFRRLPPATRCSWACCDVGFSWRAIASPMPPPSFVGTMLLAVGLGLAAAFAVLSSGVMKELFKTMARFPPPTGDLVLPIVYLAPWTVLLILVLLPVMLVRRSRRQRVEKVEQDLPICLELLATLSEAGLGFDAALSRVLDSVMENRPLGREFRTYQSDLLGGPNARGIAAAIGPPLGSLVRNDPRLGLGAGGTVGQRHHPGPSPSGRRFARSPPRTGKRLCHGTAREANVPTCDLLYARNLHLDPWTVLDPAFSGCRLLHAEKITLMPPAGWYFWENRWA